jgi:hypothetical protein
VEDGAEGTYPPRAKLHELLSISRQPTEAAKMRRIESFKRVSFGFD